MSAHPNTSQQDRDRLADPDLPDLDDQVGTGPHALDLVEEVAG
ncbi:hypothetical protein BN970_04594 [Mycolicibacterium conceptionense]|uniref:Uncharacterized protein n=1 Tax=Mycolicibacterium conceptionense TaxID=451644 RepID=A0A0U1DQC1_9MYCO|nr:hypothetical protein [Mycolicibacterium conceptionense]CQD20015.1 hypothetical protein BN970_04594 [Mycolicibacterium conceptionense]